VELQEPLSFGEAVRAGERMLEAPASDADALWLLAEDSAPEPGALDALLATLETAKSVAIAGPKLMDGRNPTASASSAARSLASGGACRSSRTSSTRGSTTG
jgi:GT2 family glycosyltransferase